MKRRLEILHLPAPASGDVDYVADLRRGLLLGEVGFGCMSMSAAEISESVVRMVYHGEGCVIFDTKIL